MGRTGKGQGRLVCTNKLCKSPSKKFYQEVNSTVTYDQWQNMLSDDVEDAGDMYCIDCDCPAIYVVPKEKEN